MRTILTKRFLLGTASALALGFGAAQLLRHSLPRRAAARGNEDGYAGARQHPDPFSHAPAASTPSQSSKDAVTRNFLLYFIVPLWLCAGVADWICHRATHIETTTGAKESFIHLLMMLEVGVPVLAAIFLEITSPVLALMIAAFFIHEATALWDVSYAVTRRDVAPIEQHVHSFLEMVPLMALSFLLVLHWQQFLALFGAGDRAADWSVRRKEEALPVRYVTTVLSAMGLLEMLPYFEEFLRGLRASDGHLVPPRAGGQSPESFARQHDARYDSTTGLVYPAASQQPVV